MVMSSLSLKPARVELFTNLGELIEHKFATKQKKGEYLAYDASELSFPELIKKSGVVDSGGYLGRYSPNLDYNRRFCTSGVIYSLRGIEGDSVTTPEALLMIEASRTQYVNASALLSVFIQNRKILRKLLVKGSRIVASAQCVFSGLGVFTTLSVREEQVVLDRVLLNGTGQWSKHDLFLVKSNPS